MAKTSKAQIAAAGRYKVKTYETISFQSPRKDRLNDLLTIGATRAGVSKAVYMSETIYNRLQRDGITAADLPPLPDETTE